jgi:hypothetical protein
MYSWRGAQGELYLYNNIRYAGATEACPIYGGDNGTRGFSLHLLLNVPQIPLAYTDKTRVRRKSSLMEGKALREYAAGGRRGGDWSMGFLSMASL